MTQSCVVPVVSNLYILGRGAALREILVEHQNLLVEHLKRHFLVSQKTFCLRDMIEII